MPSLRSIHPRQIAERMKSEEGGALRGWLCIFGYAWTTMISKHLACGFLREAMRYTSFVLCLCCLRHSARFTTSSRPALLLSGGKQSRIALHRCTRHFRLAFAHFSLPLQLSVSNLQGRGLYTPGTSQTRRCCECRLAACLHERHCWHDVPHRQRLFGCVSREVHHLLSVCCRVCCLCGLGVGLFVSLSFARVFGFKQERLT
jgi:hypothetical protein